MLAHSPPLPLIIDYLYDRMKHRPSLNFFIQDEDEKGVALAFQHRNRVRCIRLRTPVSVMKWLIAAIDGEFLVLEYLYLDLQGGSRLPETFQAPRLRHLILSNTAIPIVSPFLITCVGLVTLSLTVNSYASYSPNNLLQMLSPMLHLETLHISLELFTPSEFEIQSLLTPITTTVTLPSLV
jgi:hypothetical protein